MVSFRFGESHFGAGEFAVFQFGVFLFGVIPGWHVWTTLEISAPRCALMCYPSSNITYCIACLLCIGVILLNKFNSIQCFTLTLFQLGRLRKMYCLHHRLVPLERVR